MLCLQLTVTCWVQTMLICQAWLRVFGLGSEGASRGVELRKTNKSCFFFDSKIRYYNPRWFSYRKQVIHQKPRYSHIVIYAVLSQAIFDLTFKVSLQVTDCQQGLFRHCLDAPKLRQLREDAGGCRFFQYEVCHWQIVNVHSVMFCQFFWQHTNPSDFGRWESEETMLSVQVWQSFLGQHFFACWHRLYAARCSSKNETIRLDSLWLPE